MNQRSPHTQIAEVRSELAPLLDPMVPTLGDLLPSALPPARLLQTLYVSCASNPALMRCNRQSLINAAVSAAVLGLEVDGVTGQGYIVPFRGSAQFLVGYRGYVSLAARIGRTLEGFIAREGDAFEIDEANGRVRHSRRWGNEADRRIIAAYAVSRGEGVPTMVRALSYDQLIARRNESAGYRARGARSPWGTHFDAMARKTPQRDLAKDLPSLSLQLANSLETQHEQGHVSWLSHEAALITAGQGEHEAEPPPAQPPAQELVGESTPAGTYVITYPGALGTRSYDSLDEYEAKMMLSIRKAGTRLSEFWAINHSYVDDTIDQANHDVAERIRQAVTAAELGDA